MKRSRTVTVQDKAREIAFFDSHAEADEYNVFAPETTADIVDRFVGFAGLRAGDRVQLTLNVPGQAPLRADVARDHAARAGDAVAVRIAPQRLMPLADDMAA